MPYLPCSMLDSVPYKNNTVGSAQIGWIFSWVEGISSCIAASGIKAYACEIGQIASSPNTQ